MTNEEKQQLIKNIFASELDYREIEERLATETDPKVKADYEKKLQHDSDVIKIWNDKLKAEGIASLNTTARLQIRQEVLDELKAKEEEKKTEITTRLNDLQKLKIITVAEADMRKDLGLQEVLPGEIREDDYQTNIDAFNKILSEIENVRLLLLNELKLATKTVWQP